VAYAWLFADNEVESFWSLSKGEEGDYEKPLPPVPVVPAEILGHEQPMTTVECGGVLDEGTEAPPTTMKKKGKYHHTTRVNYG
jgi:hypothetical protein